MYVPERLVDVMICWDDVTPPDCCHAALSTVIDIHRKTPIEQPCDILVFMTGQDAIENQD
jgi:HrpA-like RNA helicase